MAGPEKLNFRKGDLLAFAIVIALAVAVFLCFLPKETPQGYARIYLDGQLIKTVSLQEDQTFEVTDRYTNAITVAGGKIAVTASNCPGQDCVHSGSIHNAGRVIVCLPNALEIRVVSADADVDIVVR